MDEIDAGSDATRAEIRIQNGDDIRTFETDLPWRETIVMPDGSYSITLTVRSLDGKEVGCGIDGPHDPDKLSSRMTRESQGGGTAVECRMTGAISGNEYSWESQSEILSEGDDDQALIWSERYSAERCLAVVGGRDVGVGKERGGVELDLEVVGRRACREPHDGLGEQDGQPCTWGQPGLHEAVAVRQGRRGRRADVGDPEDVGLKGKLDETPVEVGVVVDIDVGVTPDRQDPVIGDDVLLAAVVDDSAR